MHFERPLRGAGKKVCRQTNGPHRCPHPQMSTPSSLGPVTTSPYMAKWILQEWSGYRPWDGEIILDYPRGPKLHKFLNSEVVFWLSSERHYDERRHIGMRCCWPQRLRGRGTSQATQAPSRGWRRRAHRFFPTASRRNQLCRQPAFSSARPPL